jgi:RNA polymerase sigma-70 factor (ECF subfamily)
MSEVIMLTMPGTGRGIGVVWGGLSPGGGDVMSAKEGAGEKDAGSGDAAGRALAARVAGGDGDAFRALVLEYKSRVLGMASRYVRNHHELDDLAQEIFVRIWKGMKSFRGDAPLEHWVMRVSVRTCYDHLRKNRRRRESEVLVEEVRETGTGEGRREGSSAESSRREACEWVQWGLRQLPEKDRLILTLLELEERSVAEIAELTGWSVSNVKVRAFRARKKLKTVLEELEERE